jgi:hypothetical protein
MSHVVVIIQQTVLPPPDSLAATATASGAMTAEVKYTPPDTATPAQISNQVERIVKRLAKLADD